MKTFFLICCIFFRLFAADQDTQKILDVLKEADETSKKISNDQKNQQQIISDLKVDKELDLLQASKGEFDEKSLNSRIDRIVSYFESRKRESKREYSIKTFGVFEDCIKDKCTKIALVKQKDLTSILEELRQNRKEDIEESLVVAKGLYSVVPLSIRKQKLEMLEQNIYTASRINTSSAYSTYQNSSTDTKTTVYVKDGEIINGRYKVKLDTYSILIREI